MAVLSNFAVTKNAGELSLIAISRRLRRKSPKASLRALNALGGDWQLDIFSHTVIARSESSSDAAITFHREHDASGEK